jgi:hypothetical protein
MDPKLSKAIPSNSIQQTYQLFRQSVILGRQFRFLRSGLFSDRISIGHQHLFGRCVSLSLLGYQTTCVRIRLMLSRRRNMYRQRSRLFRVIIALVVALDDNKSSGLSHRDSLI